MGWVRDLAWENVESSYRSSITSQLARYALALRFETLPQDVVQWWGSEWVPTLAKYGLKAIYTIVPKACLTAFVETEVTNTSALTVPPSTMYCCTVPLIMV